MSNEQIIINKTDKANSVSFRTGGTGTPEFKIYFDNDEDLMVKLMNLNRVDVADAINTLKNNLGGTSK